MLVPLYAFVRGDTLGVLVLVDSTDTIAKLAHVAQNACTVRVTPTDHAVVVADGKTLDPADTVESAGLTALARIDVIQERR